MALESTPPLTEMSTRSISWGVISGRCVRLTTLLKSCAVVTKFGNHNSLEPSGPLQACNGTALYIILFRNSFVFWLHIALILIIHFTLRHGLSNMPSDEYINYYYFHAPSFLLTQYIFFSSFPHLSLKIVYTITSHTLLRNF